MSNRNVRARLALTPSSNRFVHAYRRASDIPGQMRFDNNSNRAFRMRRIQRQQWMTNTPLAHARRGNYHYGTRQGRTTLGQSMRYANSPSLRDEMTERAAFRQIRRAVRSNRAFVNSLANRPQDPRAYRHRPIDTRGWAARRLILRDLRRVPIAHRARLNRELGLPPGRRGPLIQLPRISPYRQETFSSFGVLPSGGTMALPRPS